MKTAILIHGTTDKEECYSTKYPSLSNSHWFPWITKELMVRDIHTVALEMPHAYMPNYEVWKRELERFDIDENTILVGHSCGGGFLLRYLSENPNLQVDQVVLVAPWIDPDDTKKNNFFDFTPNPRISTQSKKWISLFCSEDDMKDVIKSIDSILETYQNLKVQRFVDKGHFCLWDLRTEAFPELLDTILS